MNKAAIIIVNLILALLMGLGGCITINPPASTAPALTPPASTAPALTPPPIPASDCLIADSFNLARWDEETLERKYSEITPSQLPFNECGAYMSKYFWIKANQTLDITLMSDYPVAFEGGEEFQWGLYGQISQVEPIRRMYESWVKSHEFRQAGNMWETRVKFSPDETGWYQLCITNGSGKLSRCSYCIALTAPALSSLGVEIYEVNVSNYRTSYDLQGKPEPDCIDATLSWTTNKPCYFQFSVKPVGFDWPQCFGGSIVLFDVSQPLHQSLQVTEHSYDITLRPGTLHRYELVVWDKEGNSDRREGAFQAEGISISASSPQSGSSIDDIFLSRWGHTYYNNAPRVSFSSFDVDKLIIQISLQVPWQLYYKAGVFDCSEMTAYLEYMLERHGYTAEICQGETILGEHAWVLVYNNVADCWIPIEATSPIGSLEPIVFHILTLGMVKDHYTPRWRWEDIYHVRQVSEYDWWNSPYADQLVEASDRAKLR